MKKKLKSFVLCLSLLLTISSTAFSQDTSKYCLTPNQRRYVLEMAYRLNSCDSLVLSKNKEIMDYKSAIIDDGILLQNKQIEVDLYKGKISDLTADNKFLTGKIADSEKNVKRLKFGLYGVTLVGVVSTVYFMVR